MPSTDAIDIILFFIATTNKRLSSK